jgi:hypothetical protein
LNAFQVVAVIGGLVKCSSYEQFRSSCQGRPRGCYVKVHGSKIEYHVMVTVGVLRTSGNTGQAILLFSDSK